MGANIRVALNLAFLVPGETGGMETYARRLLSELAALDGVDPVAIVNRRAAAVHDAPWGNEVEMRVLDLDPSDRKQWVLADQIHVPRVANELGAELLHSLGSTGPSGSAMPRITTIHDLHYAVAPDAHFGLRGVGMAVLVPLAAKRSQRLIAVSQQTKNDIVAHIGIAPEKIDVVHQGVDLPYGNQAVTSPEVLSRRLNIGERKVVLSLAAKRPHKNIEGLIEGLSRVAPSQRPLLVVPGYSTEFEDELLSLAAARGCAEDVRFPGWLSDADIAGLWELASGHIFASFYEGFGLPVLEAMAQGVPGACSDQGSLPEVAGAAALQFDPNEPDQIAAAYTLLLTDEPLRQQLISAGLARARELSWHRTAQATLQTYRATLSANPQENRAAQAFS